MNNKLIWGAVAFVLFVVIFAVGTVVHLDRGRELKATQNQVQQLQIEMANLKQKLEDKDKEIVELRNSSDAYFIGYNKGVKDGKEASAPDQNPPVIDRKKAPTP